MTTHTEAGPRFVYNGPNETYPWVAVVDLSKHLRSEIGGGLRPGVAVWLRANLPEGRVGTLKFPRSGDRRGGNLIAVDVRNVDLVGMYAAHIASGKDFRAKWSDLPNSPTLDYDAKLEVWWRQGYITASEAKRAGGVGMSMRTKMNDVRHLYGRLIGKPTCSFGEAVRAVIQADPYYSRLLLDVYKLAA
ncbi:hypothetical protein NKG95_32905 [Mesorhizobium sp. M1423]|uniref:hypothetical protein n=1 Tax=Mesorhizobium sp. M1423 TaxID=2957101 RepID=UPI00333E0074